MSDFEGKPYHFIGIGGSGMSVIATLLAERGAVVSGSDRNDYPVLDTLRERGIDAYSPHGAKPFSDQATIVLSSAIRANNPELIEAQERGQTIIHRSEAMAAAAGNQTFIAVAGSHGKTTTSSMIAVALLELGADPSFAIGGPVLGHGGGGRSGTGPFVAEADESDGSFLNYKPTIEVVTGIEPDHLDYHGTHAGLEDSFTEFARRIVPGGTLICCAEDESALKLADRAKQMDNVGRVVTYGRPEHCHRPPDVAMENMVLNPDGSTGEIVSEGVRQPLELSVSGEHNLLNATAAWVACTSLGETGERSAHALSHYAGAGRRFELKGDVGGRRAYDDYAHLPAEVQAALTQAKMVAGDGQVTVVFQPHLYTRTRNFAAEFAEALSLADHVVVADIDGAREDPMDGITSQLILDEVGDHPSFVGGGPAEESALLGASLTQPGDLCLLMGCGNIFLQTPTVLSAWKKEL